MGDDIERRRASASQSQGSGGLRELLQSDKITPEHVTMAIEAMSKVLDARVQAGLMQVETDQKIRSMVAQLRDDTARAEQAVAIFDHLQEHLDPQTRSAVAAEIVRMQLGKR